MHEEHTGNKLSGVVLQLPGGIPIPLQLLKVNDVPFAGQEGLVQAGPIFIRDQAGIQEVVIRIQGPEGKGDFIAIRTAHRQNKVGGAVKIFGVLGDTPVILLIYLCLA